MDITYGQIVATLIIVLGLVNIFRMAFFMIGSDFYTVRHALHKRRNKHVVFGPPTISIIVPAHNEENTILRTIRSLQRVKYPKDKLEIVIVDDGSTDRTYAIAERYRLQHNVNFKLVRQENAGKAHALNNGMRNHATGELMMCLDADSSLAPDALINAARYFIDPRVVALSANVKIRPTGKLFNLIQVFEYLICYQMKRAQTVFNIEYIIGGIGSTFRRSALAQVGYYDTDTITEDIDLTMKLLRLGGKDHRVIYGSDVIAYTESVLDLAGLIRQRFRWKYGRAQTFIKNRVLFFSRDAKHSRWLTWFYLPYALFSDLAFFFEPFMVSYIAYIVVAYGDWVTLASAFGVVGGYITLNILAEDTIPLRLKLVLAVIAPFMYFFFYVLSYVEYLALIKTYMKFWQIPASIEAKNCGWTHVERAKA
jgi:cellulose synthase/poly-beta-1,6-N-acetylglucosamine synthase-like glycosyltransferase